MALHSKHTMPSMTNTIQMSFAKGEESEVERPDAKLFIGMLARTATDQDVRALVSPYGQVGAYRSGLHAQRPAMLHHSQHPAACAAPCEVRPFAALLGAGGACAQGRVVGDLAGRCLPACECRLLVLHRAG